ncbi:MAG TPA: hypothetical protein VGK24_12265 [Candidatus Angelobacter sp.]|jgi:hypothetical protein
MEIADQPGGNLPLGMLPVRTADTPKATNLSDRTIYEFPIIGAVALADGLPWTPISLLRAGRNLRILKPTIFATHVKTQGELSDQFLDVRYTVFRIETDLYPEPVTPQPLEIYQAIHELVHLLRTVARQYWIGFAMANEGSLVQGLRSRVELGIAAFTGQGSFVTPFVVSPINQLSWQFLGQLLDIAAFPAIAEVMLCDALLEIRRGDILQSILLLGVASEVATVSFLEDLISQKSLSKTKQDEIKKSSFANKLMNETVNLGADSPAATIIPGFPADWL